MHPEKGSHRTRSLSLSMVKAQLELGCVESPRSSLRSWSHSPGCKLAYFPFPLGAHNCHLRGTMLSFKIPPQQYWGASGPTVSGGYR